MKRIIFSLALITSFLFIQCTKEAPLPLPPPPEVAEYISMEINGRPWQSDIASYEASFPEGNPIFTAYSFNPNKKVLIKLHSAIEIAQYNVGEDGQAVDMVFNDAATDAWAVSGMLFITYISPDEKTIKGAFEFELVDGREVRKGAFKMVR